MGERGRTARAIAAIVFGAFILVSWFPRAWAGRWIADDYCFAASSVRDGFWRSQQIVYLTTSGRFSVAFVYAGLTRAGRWTAPYLSLGMMLIWLVAAWRTARHALPQTSRLEQLAAGTVFVAAIVAAAPDSYQPLIWTGGVATYGTPIVLATAIAAMLVRRPDSSRSAAIGMSLAFFAGGCSEVAAAAQVIFAMALAPFVPRARRSLIAIAIASGLALALVAVAPGNFNRRSMFNHVAMPDALSTALAGTPRMLSTILLEGYAPFVVLVVFIALLPRRHFSRSRLLATIASLASCAVVAVTLCAARYGTGRLPWGRVQFIPVAFTAIGLTFVALAIRVEKRSIALALTAVMMLLAIVDIVSMAPVRIRSIEEARQFASAADEVDKFARERKGHDLAVPAPRQYEFLEFLARDQNNWTNRCMAEYYGLTSISGR